MKYDYLVVGTGLYGATFAWHPRWEYPYANGQWSSCRLIPLQKQACLYNECWYN